MRDDLLALIGASYSAAEAQRYAEYSYTRSHLDDVISIGKEVLGDTPKCPGACAIMSALWTVNIRDRLGLPVYCVAGDLIADGARVFGRDASTERFATAFDQSNLDWDGHCWIVFEKYVGDVSVFRTAYSAGSPKALKKLVLSRFGRGRGILLSTEASNIEAGLTYVPKYVLTERQLTGLLLAGQALFSEGGQGSAA